MGNVYDDFENGDYDELLDNKFAITDDELDLMSERYRGLMGKDYDEEKITNLIAWISMVRFEMYLIDMCVKDGLLVADWDVENGEPLIHQTKESRRLVSNYEGSWDNSASVEKLIADIFHQDNDID
jgi:hypothetical protein